MFTTSIASFHQDAQGDWVAALACGHAQHVRHRPPWENRAWVQTEEGRAAKVGVAIDCPLCAMPVLPSEAVEYKRTATFTEATVPPGLLADHHTKPGVWARIVVETGQLEYRLTSPPGTFVLTPESPGIVPAAIAHAVRPLGPVRFHVVFLRVDGT